MKNVHASLKKQTKKYNVAHTRKILKSISKTKSKFAGKTVKRPSKKYRQNQMVKKALIKWMAKTHQSKKPKKTKTKTRKIKSLFNSF
jgi:hypothetical protein